MEPAVHFLSPEPVAAPTRNRFRAFEDQAPKCAVVITCRFFYVVSYLDVVLPGRPWSYSSATPVLGPRTRSEVLAKEFVIQCPKSSMNSALG